MVDSSSFVLSAVLSLVVADKVKLSVSVLFCCIVVSIRVPSVSFGVVARGNFGSVVVLVLSVVVSCAVDVVGTSVVGGMLVWTSIVKVVVFGTSVFGDIVVWTSVVEGMVVVESVVSGTSAVGGTEVGTSVDGGMVIGISDVGCVVTPVVGGMVPGISVVRECSVVGAAAVVGDSSAVGRGMNSANT